MACNRLRDRVELLVFHIIEGQDGEGGPAQEGLHLVRDEAAETLQQEYERAGDLMEHEIVCPPQRKRSYKT